VFEDSYPFAFDDSSNPCFLWYRVFAFRGCIVPKVFSICDGAPIDRIV